MAAISIAPAAPATALSFTFARNAGWRRATASTSLSIRAASWSMRRMCRDQARQGGGQGGSPAAARAAGVARSGWGYAAGVARSPVRRGPVRLSVPLWLRAVVRAEDRRLARQLPQVLLRPVPLRHDRRHAVARGAGNAHQRPPFGSGGDAGAPHAAAADSHDDPGGADHAWHRADRGRAAQLSGATRLVQPQPGAAWPWAGAARAQLHRRDALARHVGLPFHFPAYALLRHRH